MEPRTDADLASQLILGEPVAVLARRGGFLLAQGVDEYAGWLEAVAVRRCATTPHGVGRSPGTRYVIRAKLAPVLPVPRADAPPVMQLVFGTRVPVLRQVRSADGTFYEIRLPVRRRGAPYRRGLYTPAAALIPENKIPRFTGAAAAALALEFLGVPYLWGGTTPLGFDCSGFVQRVCGFLGAYLPRDAYEQAACARATRIAELERLRPGDLVFFAGTEDPRGRGITHVGMNVDEGRFVHASGKLGVTVTQWGDPAFDAEYAFRGGLRWRGACAERGAEPPCSA